MASDLMPADMPVGAFFSITGYDLVAFATCDYGAVLLLCNNSDHYLVAETEIRSNLAGRGRFTALLNERARLVTSFMYDGAGAAEAYGAALSAMSARALECCASLSEA